MYKVSLTTEKYYQKINSFEEWKLDSDYFIFYWDRDKTHVIVKKEYVITIEKY